MSQPPDQKPIEVRQRNTKRLFTILLIIGLVIGGLVSIGVVAVMKRFGLTDNQPQIEQQ
jgi:LPS O-antigen subunit length determinant protein (WzzB/FepE family)